MLVDLAAMSADRGLTISDLGVLRPQLGLFGLVASMATAWRALDGVDEDALSGLRASRGAGAGVAGRAELRGSNHNPSRPEPPVAHHEPDAGHHAGQPGTPTQAITLITIESRQSRP